METTKTKTVEKFYFALVAVLFFFLVTNGFAQNRKISDLVTNKYAVKNITNSIHSPNMGVRESVIYLVGEYRFIEMEDELIKQLQVEKEPDIKVLIGLALFRMNSEKGMNELQVLASEDTNPRVKKMSQAIYNEYLVNNANRTATAH